MEATVLTRLTRIPLRTRRTAVTALLVGLATAAVAAGLNLGRPSAQPTIGTGPHGVAALQRTAGAAPPPVPALTQEHLATLPAATTTATLPAAPRDTSPGADTDGTVVHNTQ